MWGISILADFRPMGYKLLCCGSLWFRLEPFIQICSRSLCGQISLQYFVYILGETMTSKIHSEINGPLHALNGENWKGKQVFQ